MSIQSEISRLNGAKSSIESSLNEMGVEVPSDAKMETLANLLQNEVVGHIQNTNNPHQVTASQIGAATSSDIESYVIANPTLIGTESNLQSIQIGDTSYTIPSGISGPSASFSGHIPIFSNSSGNILDDGYGVAVAISNDSSSIPRTDAVNLELLQRIKSYEVTTAEYIAMESAGTLDSSAAYFINDDIEEEPVIIDGNTITRFNGILKGNGSNIAIALEGTDYVTPSILNTTQQALETQISNKLDTSGNGSDVTVAFTTASTRTNISTGEKLGVIFGKIAKWFSDLGAAAFRGVDAAPTANSTNLVESGGVKSAIADVTPTSEKLSTGSGITIIRCGKMRILIVNGFYVGYETVTIPQSDRPMTNASGTASFCDNSSKNWVTGYVTVKTDGSIQFFGITGYADSSATESEFTGSRWANNCVIVWMTA